MTHLAYTLLLTVLLSGAAAMMGDRPGRERAYAAAYTFLSCAFIVFAGSWVMYWIHG
jgi:hypothetical protein